ncbi:MAG: rdd family [Verrucomicrobiales bacterium]|nr:rdd family [Verrucomicrobiales bacterium]
MDVYVLKEGRRLGPFVPFKVRELMEDGEISPSDLGWVEGMDSWAPLETMEPLAGWMPRKPGEPPPLPSPEQWAEKTAAARLRRVAETNEKARPLRAIQRWVARLVDAALWNALAWTVGVQAGWLDVWSWVPGMSGLLVALVPPLLWLPVEATLLAFLGTTPGKWFLGIRITDDLGQKLAWTAAMKRAALAHVTGNGIGFPVGTLLPVIQWSLSWMFYRRTGTTLWDRAAGSEVVHTGVPAMGLITVALTGIGWMWVFMQLALHAPIPADFPPEMRVEVESMRHQLQDMGKEIEKQSQQQPQSPAAVPSQSPAAGGTPAPGATLPADAPKTPLEPAAPPAAESSPQPAPPPQEA